MTAKRRLIPNFEGRSVMLLAFWALGTAAGAQTPDTATSRPMAQMTAPSAAPAAPKAAATSSKDMDAAFVRADTSKDGKLSREEAEQLPAVAQRFEQIDADGDKFISRAEFDKAMKP
ncbi:MAG: EF-hand domain-containing protein [Burkholderiaceae bacterium]